MKNSSFYSEGLRFQCQGSGNCCVSRGGYGFVYLTKADRQKIAEELGMPTRSFTIKFCEQADGIWKLKDIPGGDCRFLKNNRCEIYHARPVQCRTWPFWPEVLNAKTWTKEVASFCPGVGKGKTWSKEEIEVQLQDQIKSEKGYGS